MAFLFNIPAARGFYCESNLRRGFAHGELVTSNPSGISQLLTDKIHVWGTFMVFSRGYPIYIPCPGIQAEMALGGASLLYRFLHLQLGFCRIPVCIDCS